MNRMTLIAVVLCAVLLATVGAGVVTAKQGMNPGKHNGADQGRGRKQGGGVGEGPLAVTLHAHAVTNGEIDKAEFYAVVTAGTPVRYVLVRSDTNAVLYDGNNPNLGGAYVTYEHLTTPPTVTLTAYDNAGNTCTSSWPT